MKKQKRINCGECVNNDMGCCVLYNNKEIPISYILDKMQKTPKWCPLTKDKQEKI